MALFLFFFWLFDVTKPPPNPGVGGGSAIPIPILVKGTYYNLRQFDAPSFRELIIPKSIGALKLGKSFF
jgi:hypothetical protein